MSTGFQKDALARGRLPGGLTPVLPTWWQRNWGFVIGTGAGIVIALLLVQIFVVTHPSHNTDAWPYTSMNDTSHSTYLAVHLNSSDKIDKVYRDKELQKLTQKERVADNVVLFFFDDEQNRGIADYGFSVPAIMMAEGVSYPLSPSFRVSYGSMKNEISAYNSIVDKKAGITLRGMKDVPSLGLYLLDTAAPSIKNAIKSGALTPPTVTYSGTSTEYHNNNIATAYKVGISADLFAQQCQPDNQNPNGVCPSYKATYDFGCKSLGIKSIDWAAFQTQLYKVVRLPGMQFDPGVYFNSPSRGQLTINTPEPCRITQSGGEPSTLPQLPHQDPNNVDPGNTPPGNVDLPLNNALG